MSIDLKFVELTADVLEIFNTHLLQAVFLVLAIYYAGEFFLNGKGPILLFKSMRCMIYIPCVYVRMTRVFFSSFLR